MKVNYEPDETLQTRINFSVANEVNDALAVYIPHGEKSDVYRRLTEMLLSMTAKHGRRGITQLLEGNFMLCPKLGQPK